MTRAEAPTEPGARSSPLALDRRDRHVEGTRDVRHFEPAVVAHLDDARLAFVQLGQFDERVFEVEHVDLARDSAVVGDRVVERHRGATSLELARRVGERGNVLGVDISAPMLARARERASTGNVRFLEADAQSHPFEAEHDLVFSRFGIMFFDDPAAAFENLHSALASGGRLGFVCWQALSENAWLTVPLQAAAQVIPLPPPPEPGAPGPLALADPDRVRGLLAGAGFREIELEDARDSLGIGGQAGLDVATDFLLEIGPTSAALRELGDEAEARRPAVADAVRKALAPYAADGGVRLPSAAWIVTARG